MFGVNNGMRDIPSSASLQPNESNVSLKNLSVSHIDDFMKWATDDEVTKYMMWNSYKSIQEAETFFKNVVEKHLWFKAICLGEVVIGSMTLDKRVHKAELGYVIARKYWGKGLATQAVKLALTSCFAELLIERVEAYVDPENVASKKVLEKNGFICGGLLKDHVVQKGILKDRIVYYINKQSC
jgi:ribosomal-protein-alanine N-acetyltransferase